MLFHIIALICFFPSMYYQVAFENTLPHFPKVYSQMQFNPVWTHFEFTVEKCFSCFFLILYISNVIKNAYIFFPPQKLKIWRHGEKNQLFVYFDQKLKTAILDLFSTKLKVQDLKSKKKKKKVDDGPFLDFFAPIRFSLQDPP